MPSRISKRRQRLAKRRTKVLDVGVGVVPVRVIEQVKEVRLERQCRTFVDFEFLADVKIHVGVPRTDQAVTPDWNVAPVAPVDRQRTAPMAIVETLRIVQDPLIWIEVSVTRAATENRAARAPDWHYPVGEVAILVQVVAAAARMRRHGVACLKGNDRVNCPASDPPVAFHKRQVVADGADHAVGRVEVRWTVVIPDIHVIRRVGTSTVVEQIAHRIKRLGVRVVDVEAKPIRVRFSNCHLQSMVVRRVAIAAVVVRPNFVIDALGT